MSIAKRILVGDTPTLIHQADNDGCHIDLRLQKGETVDVVVGDQNVTFADGFEFDAAESPSPILEINLASKESVYGICDSGQSSTIDCFVTQDKRHIG